MTKEIYISSTPHETRLAVVEDDQLAEIYYERENEYTLAGSVYKGKVTRVLPGMQSAFVDIGLERDAFLYITDFAEEQEDSEEYVPLSRGRAQGNGDQHPGERHAEQPAPTHQRAEIPSQESHSAEGGEDGASRRWRGRRGRRRGRGAAAQERTSTAPHGVHLASRDENGNPNPPEAIELDLVSHEQEVSPEQADREEFVQPSIDTHGESSIGRPTPAREHPSAQQAPMILPGESLSKYRHGQPPSESERTSKPARETSPAAPPQSSFHPSTMVTTPLAWDGGDLLPGESLSRYKNKLTAPEPQHSPSPAAEIDAPAAPIAEPVAEPEQHDPQPTETSASYRFDPAAPSAYRQSGIAEPETEEFIPEAESAIEPIQEEAPVIQSDQPEAPESHREEVDRETVEDSSPTPALQPEPPSFAAESASTSQAFPTETRESGQEVFDESDLDPEHDAHIFDPGRGNLEEETIEEEETENIAAESLEDEEGYDDLVEETLDVKMDSGLLSELVRDRYVDQRTGYSEDHGHGVETGDEAHKEEASDFHEEHGEIELEEVSDTDLDADEEASEGEESHPDATHARPGGARSNRRGTRNQRSGHGGNRGRMRRSTAQTTNLPAITELLKPNQEILVQIAKEPIARKGARITSHIALPGRFLVFMPTVNHVGVSRKISSDEQRQRLKHILLSEKGTASGGFIVRTAAATASEEDLRADIRFLLTLWAEIKQRADSSNPPALIYHDLSLVERVLRDQVTDNFSAIWVDSELDYERVLRFLNRFEPELVRRVKLYSKATPLFEQFGIQEEINKALRSKVWLKSGGSIVINQTEALVAIDINTGKYVGKTARLEDTILKTNLDAIPEIVRQIRLRDLGGIIVIDFIDMDERKNRNKVMQALEDELKSDRAPSKVLQFNDFGLVAITRKRVKQSLERTLSVPCSVCTGTGMVKGPLTVCNEIYIELRKMRGQIDGGDIMLRVNPEVVKQLKAANGRWLSEMEEMSGKTIIVKSDAALHPEQFDIH